MDEAKVFDDRLFAPHDFMMVTPGLVAALGGNAVAALVAIRIRYREQTYGRADEDGVLWWRASQSELASDTGLSDDQVQRAVKRLVDIGLVEKRKERKGQAKQWDQTLSYRIVTVVHSAPTREPPTAPTRTLHPAPMRTLHPAPPRNLIEGEEEEQEEEQERDGPSADADVLPFLPFPDCSDCSEGLVPVRCADCLNIEAQMTPAPTPLKGRQKRTVVHIQMPQFDAWWEAYPRKVGKGAARTSYERVVRLGLLTEAQLLEAVEKYRTQCPTGRDARFIPNPATWLNQERWLDAVPVGGGGRTVAAGHDQYWANGGAFMEGRI